MFPNSLVILSLLWQSYNINGLILEIIQWTPLRQNRTAVAETWQFKVTRFKVKKETVRSTGVIWLESSIHNLYLGKVFLCNSTKYKKYIQLKKNLLKLNRNRHVMPLPLYSTLSLQCIMPTMFVMIKQNEKAAIKIKAVFV